MYFEILVEDASGKVMLEHLVPKILGPRGKPHKYRIINIQELKHRVMAQMPRHLAKTLPWDTILFQTLSLQLKAYSKSFSGRNVAVIIIVDLDYHDFDSFRKELESLFDSCESAPNGSVCLAVEEGEAWLLGDPEAVRHAYPFAKDFVLDSYVQDSICGTWEWLADAIFHGGSDRLTEIGYPLIGREKCQWADNIAQYVDVDRNHSKSFRHFRDRVRYWARRDEIDDDENRPEV